ncbi:hypothetical protein L6R49_27945 [Myxococcota bacterium]|nr:hypothetical protein [Myxococcota bacterium]
MPTTMTIERMRGRATDAPATDVARALQDLLPRAATQTDIVFSFKLAFPDIPLLRLVEASVWSGVCEGGLSDEEFNAALGPWIPTRRA